MEVLATVPTLVVLMAGILFGDGIPWILFFLAFELFATSFLGVRGEGAEVI